MTQQENTPQFYQLATGIELLTGPDEMPLLYVGERKSYLRLSEAGAQIIRLLCEQSTMTLDELSQRLVGQAQADNQQAQQQIKQFLLQLDAAGALASAHTEPPIAPSVGRRMLNRIAARPRLEFALWHPDRPLAANFLRALQARIGHVIGRLITFLILLTIIVVTYAALSPQSTFNSGSVAWPLLLAITLLHTAGHEMAHALVSSYFGVKVRELGVALLYYFIPVAYTDRTDAYRLRHFRQRAYIALAGPVFDLFATGLSALIFCLTSGWVSSNFRVLMWLQLAGFITNLNPLLPGDAFHILEAWFGALNFRRRAFTVFWRRLTFRHLPAYLQTLTFRQQAFHFGYAALATVYLCLLAWVVLGQAWGKAFAAVK